MIAWKIDALALAALSLTGTGVVVEHSHRVDIKKPEMVAIAEVPVEKPHLRFCASAAGEGDEQTMTRYLASLGDALGGNPFAWCDANSE